MLKKKVLSVWNLCQYLEIQVKKSNAEAQGRFLHPHKTQWLVNEQRLIIIFQSVHNLIFRSKKRASKASARG